MQKLLATVIVMFPPAEGEKTAAEEKEKDKETSAATEAAEAKEKAEVADVKKGASYCLWYFAAMNT